MSEKLKGSLSAIIDGEADEFELRRVLDEIDKNEELRGTWERYHLIGARLRGERIDTRAKLRQQVWDALDLEEVPGATGVSPEVDMGDGSGNRVRPRPGRWTGIAVAATVAVAVVLGLSTFNKPVDDSAPMVVAIDGPVIQEPLVELTTESTAVDILRQDARMLLHTQQVGMNQLGFAAFVKMATYERQ